MSRIGAAAVLALGLWIATAFAVSVVVTTTNVSESMPTKRNFQRLPGGLSTQVTKKRAA